MRVKYELVVSLYKNERVHLAGHAIDYCPQVGSIVNIDGNPFVVYSVESAIYELSGKVMVGLYVRVFKAGCFELQIGGKNY